MRRRRLAHRKRAIEGLSGGPRESERSAGEIARISRETSGSTSVPCKRIRASREGYVRLCASMEPLIGSKASLSALKRGTVGMKSVLCGSGDVLRGTTATLS